MAVPRVSVCIPAYSAGPFIGEAIESVLKQTMSDFELIVVDNASTDHTAQVINRFKDERIRIFSNETTIDVGSNWNRAVSECRAPLIKLLCADDLIYPDCLAMQTQAMDDPAIALVCGPRDIIDPSGRVLLRGRGFGKLSGKIPGDDAIRRIVRSGTNPMGEPVAVMFRALTFSRVGGFDGSSPFVLDVDFWCRALQTGSLLVLPQTVGAFRISRGALSTQLARKQQREARAFFSRLALQRPDLIRRSDLRLAKARAALLAPARQLLYRLLWRRR